MKQRENDGFLEVVRESIHEAAQPNTMDQFVEAIGHLCTLHGTSRSLQTALRDLEKISAHNRAISKQPTIDLGDIVGAFKSHLFCDNSGVFTPNE
jgi:hypothetical protein